MSKLRYLIHKAIRIELRQIKYLAMLAAAAPDELTRSIILCMIQDEAAEAKFWNTVDAAYRGVSIPGEAPYPGPGYCPQPGMPYPGYPPSYPGGGFVPPAGPVMPPYPPGGPVTGPGAFPGTAPGILPGIPLSEPENKPGRK
ncbi:MAG: hypothetical protein HPY89_06610 [Pelotomaculum sp.]|uniref:Uncharacterized protein n=1 Tax=Pelotomaculum thermopropionicum (strain DSM 13744 / JCM 10971 / SI) TaxID=370438 RepID=A5D4Y7_PELTS|nr:hypothetical protein [Pelotomaculum sp.]BAF58703.1 hypothetical protein PTH_0522 [Pelotomaculum thermopropionicum SI]